MSQWGRLDNVAPYRMGGHREACFSVRVYAHYKFMFAACREYYMSCSSVLCLFLVLSVFSYCYVRQTKLASSLKNVRVHYKIVIVWLTDRLIYKSFLCHPCVVLYTVYVFYVRTAPVRSQHVAPRCTLRNSRPRLLPRLPLPTEWRTARRHCRRLWAPLSNRDKHNLILLSFSVFNYFLGRRKNW